MEFEWPALLLLLLLAPVLVLVYLRAQRRRQQMAARFASLGVAATGAGWRRHIPPGLFLLGLVCLLVASARPHTTVSLPRREGTVILAFDVSGSMSAEDMQPNRMEAAKAAVLDFVERQPESILVGVVAFSDSGFSVQHPTNDKAEILAAINRMKPQRGTALGSGILASLNTITSGNAANWVAPKVFSNLTPEPTATPTPMPPGVYQPAVIILLTDGDNNQDPDPQEVAQFSAERGVRIYTIGIGSEAGATVTVNGFTVHTELNADLLRAIAETTDGKYFQAQTEEDLHKIYETITPQFVVKPENTEVTALFAAGGLLIFLLAGIFSLVWFSRLP